ncbi:deoxyribose-phosphate aldolase [Gaetbulibacter aestuarii]|uniref:Deoxyribose-phosphate aldolase n=1 Tax=Gaetbulibacter aestuarii TaxID=1502358 RepID=A0ABW7N2F4_9FLAO
MKSLNSYIDHTLLKSTATKQDIQILCKEAIDNQFFSVCLNSCYVALAKSELSDSAVRVCSVVGFPLGAMSSQAKIEEANGALYDGADEIDMVMNIGLFKSQDYKAVVKDIQGVKNLMPDRVLKVIIETCYLKDFEITKASELVIEAGADFIKTSTGFGPRGASIHDIKLIKSVIRPEDRIKIKASGGIRDSKTAMEYIDLGVDRLGTSSGIAMMSNQTSNSDY